MKSFNTIMGFILLILAVATISFWFPETYTIPPKQYDWRWWIGRGLNVTLFLGFIYMWYLNIKQSKK